MKRLAFLILLLTVSAIRVIGAPMKDRVTTDSIPTGKTKQAVQSPYKQAPVPIIMPGTHLNPAFRSLAKQDPSVRQAAPGWLRAQTKGDPTYILDGKVATINQINQIKRLKQADVASITTLDSSKATALYGPNAKQGLLLITTKAGL